MKRASLMLLAILVIIGGAMPPLCHAGSDSDEDGRATPAQPTRGILHEHEPAQLVLSPPPSPSALRAPTAMPTNSGLETTMASSPTRSPQQQQPLSSDLLVQRLEAFNVVMTIDGVLLPLGESSKRIFKTVTRDSIAKSVRQVLGASQVHDLEVSISLTSSSRMLRNENIHGDTITFDVLILIRSVIQIHDLKRYISSAFNDNMDIYMYTNALKASGDVAFRDITTVYIAYSFDTSTSRTTTTTNRDSATKKRDTSYLIAAILSVVVAVAAGIGLVVCFLQYQRQQQRLEIKKRIRRNTTFLSSFTLEQGFASEIEIGACTDMSSLGDPSLIGQFCGGGAGGLVFMDVVPTSVHDGVVAVVEEEEEDKSILDAADSVSVHSAPSLSRNETVPQSLEDNIFSFPSSNSLPLLAKEMDFEDYEDSQQSQHETGTILDIESVTHMNRQLKTSPSNFGVFRCTDAEGNVVEYWYA